jgi:ribosomal protein S18 acetylase RimI-like enzyme
MVKPRFEPLAWDTAHYGMQVGRICGDVRDSHELAEPLEQAKSAGAKLVYFLHVHPLALDARLLDRYGGKRVAGYVRFALALSPAVRAARAPIPGVPLEVFRGPADDPRVLALGVDAGWLSRFRGDPRLPPEKCDELYQIWTKRSILGELADETLVARMDDAPVGLVTYRCHEDRAEIGLLGLAPAARGRGIGSALLAYAHERMAARGRARSEVVTQSENEGACRLYRRAGYAPVVEGAYYHFHLAQRSGGEGRAWTSR